MTQNDTAIVYTHPLSTLLYMCVSVGICVLYCVGIGLKKKHTLFLFPLNGGNCTVFLTEMLTLWRSSIVFQHDELLTFTRPTVLRDRGHRMREQQKER